MPKQLAAIYITHKDESGPSLPGYSLDALCWAWLDWVVAFQGTGGDWLEPTHACLEILPLSPSVFLSPLHPIQYSAAFIQLTHEEILHKRKKLPAPMTRKNKFSKAGIKEKRKSAEPTLLQQDKKKSQKSLSLHPVEIFRLCFLSLILFSFAVVLEN